jgi:hypothetical protein
MKRPDISRDRYFTFTSFAGECSPAHSGPELATCVPDPALAQDLARQLLSDQFELTRNSFTSNSGAPALGGFTIGLARR